MSEVLIEFDIPADTLNMNDSLVTRWDQKQRRANKNLWWEAAYYAAVRAFPGTGPQGRRMPPCDVYVSIPVPGHRGRDPHNFYPTIKPIIDAIVEAGIWPDDVPQWVTTHEPDLRVVPPKQLLKSKVYVRLVPRDE